jgi:hypothetical protein
MAAGSDVFVTTFCEMAGVNKPQRLRRNVYGVVVRIVHGQDKAEGAVGTQVMDCRGRFVTN